MEKAKADDSAKAGREALKRPGVRAALALGAVVVLVVVIVLIASGGESGGGGESGEAKVVSAEALREEVSSAGTPVYWAGEQPGSELELSQPGGERTYVRYLTGGAKAGDPRPIFLTVGTYAQAKPVAALRRQGMQPGGVVGSAPGHATVYFNRDDPHSVYLAYPGVPVEIEVYDPSFKRALRLVDSGQIVAAG